MRSTLGSKRSESPRTRRGHRAGRRHAVALLRSVLVLSLLAAGSGTEARGDEAEAPPPPVDRDALFRLPPDAASVSRPRVGGVTRERWEERFEAARQEVQRAQERVAETQRELEALASDSESWQVAAPGAQASSENSPLSYKLRQEIRRRREAVDQAQRRLRELETEASLAGVPAEWRRPPPLHEDAAPPSRR